MRKSLVRISRKLNIPICFLIIAYCIFYQYILNLPYIFILKLVLLLLSLFLMIINLFGGTVEDRFVCSHNSFIRRMYLHSRQIVTWTFICYFVIYLICFLDRKSILYNYIVLLLFGLYVGYEIAIMASHYKKK